MPRRKIKKLASIAVEEMSSGDEVSDIESDSSSRASSDRMFELTQDIDDDDDDGVAEDNSNRKIDKDSKDSENSEQAIYKKSKEQLPEVKRKERIKLPLFIAPPSTSKKSLYTTEEEERILKHVIKNKEYCRLKGNVLWQEMQDTGDFPGRTWQSLKERFRRFIAPSLHRFSIKPKYAVQITDAMGLSTSAVSYKTNGHQKVSSNASSASGSMPCEPKKSTSYSENEDRLIVRYIVAHQSHLSGIKGNAFWRDMEHSNKVPGRTWQGIKERFMKRILPNLFQYGGHSTGLNESNASKILAAGGIVDREATAILKKLSRMSTMSAK